jgi:hypothetical protein
MLLQLQFCYTVVCNSVKTKLRVNIRNESLTTIVGYILIQWLAWPGGEQGGDWDPLPWRLAL